MSWPAPQDARRVQRIAVATHNQRFFTQIRATLEAEGDVLLDDAWHGHRQHHEPLSRSAAAWADVVFAEWCLGNAVWHATHRPDDTRLIVRFHRFEVTTDFPHELDIDAVESVVFVADHVRNEARVAFDWPGSKCHVIHNSVDTHRFHRPKTGDARFTLGMVTWNRQLKRLDLALDLLERLVDRDPRYELRLKGESPEDVGHIWKYPEERDYFTEQFHRIESSSNLRGRVHIEGEGDDVPRWLTRVGHILSLSDVESFHLALAEGMASRAVPVIRARRGADQLFSREWITDDVGAMAQRVVAHTDTMPWAEAGHRARQEIVERYDESVIQQQWVHLVHGPA